MKKLGKKRVSFTDWLRRFFKWLIDPIGGFLNRIGLTPNAVTMLGLIGSVLFLLEKSVNERTGKSQYKHRSIRSAHRSLKHFLPYLFTYKEHPDLKIPTTTNQLDGGLFSPLKDLLKVHRGSSRELRRKLIIYFLENRVYRTPKILL